MSEQDKIDGLLRRSMGAVPAPQLSAKFEQRLAKRLRPRRLSLGGRWAMGVYALLAVLISVWVMRSAAIHWFPMALAIVAPLLLAVVVQYRHRGLRA